MFDRASTLSQVLAAEQGRLVLDKHMPGVAQTPVAISHPEVRIGQLAAFAPSLRDSPDAREALWSELAAVTDGPERREYLEAVTPSSSYEGRNVPEGSAELSVPATTPKWGIIELVLQGPDHGNPFVDVDVSAHFRTPTRDITVGGFYDGDGVYRIRALALEEGTWNFRITSNARSLHGLHGHTQVINPEPDTHGPVRATGFHFRYDDGTVHRPQGTTAYAWIHQPAELQERTLTTLASAPFTKLRMCLFPKHYAFNANEPTLFVFPRTAAGEFDYERFDVEFFRNLEQRLTELEHLGIQADLILFHAYDRWGFADMGPAVDDRYVRYVVRRLAAHANVWWAMANEYELMWSKEIADWERLASIVNTEDPFGHLMSIHNIATFYDHSQPWVTHVSAQRVDPYRTAENTDAWRRWNKPVIIDECGYEGDIDQGWGNLPGYELIRRYWEGAIRGGYVGHGETYLNDKDELWWSKGGELIGSSPSRIAFLDDVLASAPEGIIEPLPSEIDVPWGGIHGRFLLGYFGINQPKFRDVRLPEGEYQVDIIDTWNMTVETLDGGHSGSIRIDLPGRPYMAVRCTRLPETPELT